MDCDIKQLIGKTIKSIEVIKAEYGRTYDYYTCFVCTDGTKLMVYDGCRKPFSPNLEIEEMKKAPNYFTVEDIANRQLEIEKKRRYAIEEQRQKKKRQLESLKKELGEQ